MRSERPLIASVVFLATGLSLIFGYCTGATSFNAAYPLACFRSSPGYHHHGARCGGRNRACRCRDSCCSSGHLLAAIVGRSAFWPAIPESRTELCLQKESSSSSSGRPLDRTFRLDPVDPMDRVDCRLRPKQIRQLP